MNRPILAGAIGLLTAAALTTVATQSVASAHSSGTAASPQALAAAAASSLVAARPAALHASASDAFVARPVVAGGHGLQYAPYERTYRGLPVVGGDFVVVTDEAAPSAHLTVAQTRRSAR